MTEELIGRLSMIRGLRVMSRTSVMGFKDTPLAAKDIGLPLSEVPALYPKEKSWTLPLGTASVQLVKEVLLELTFMRQGCKRLLYAAVLVRLLPSLALRSAPLGK